MMVCLLNIGGIFDFWCEIEKHLQQPTRHHKKKTIDDDDDDDDDGGHVRDILNSNRFILQG